jgi:hypothetical protein
MYGNLAFQVGECQVWDSKIWPGVPWDSDPRKTILARLSSNRKVPTYPLSRESSPLKKNPQLCKGNKKINKLMKGLRWVPETKTDLLIVGHNMSLSFDEMRKIPLQC